MAVFSRFDFKLFPLLAAATTLAATAFSMGCSKQEPAAKLTPIATVSAPAVDESSGLAASRRTPGLLWTHNDSDGQPVLYAINSDGRLHGSVRVAGIKNIDWEDMASFELDGRSWLLIADTGDNSGRRKDCALYIIAEPDAEDLSPGRELSVPVAWKTPVRYPDGPHDCESVAVDVREGNVYLLRKRIHPNALFVLPLRPTAPDATPMAREVGWIKNIPQPNSEQRAFPVATGRWRGNPTSMDIAADGRCAVVLTYGDVLLFPRRPGETWSTALSRRPLLLPPHGLEQAEAVCFSPDGRAVFVTEEKLNTPLLRYDLAPLSTP
jgi:hypothetical protein